MDKFMYICLGLWILGSAYRIYQIVVAVNNHAQFLLKHEVELDKLKKKLYGFGE
jgi:hypothetical protein